MRESRLEQIGHVLLDEGLIAHGVCSVQGHTDLTFLYQVKHVSQDRRVHRQTWRKRTDKEVMQREKHTQTHGLYTQPSTSSALQGFNCSHVLFGVRILFFLYKITCKA